MFEAREEGGGDGDGTAEQACGLFRKFKDDPQALVRCTQCNVILLFEHFCQESG